MPRKQFLIKKEKKNVFILYLLVDVNLDILSKNNFDFLYVVGRGGFGKVWKVYSKKYKTAYALKEMAKAKIIDKKSEKSISYEKQLLSQINHPFIVNMNYAFQDSENLYLVMDLLNGGDLRFHVSRYKKFNEEQTRFFVACILLGLDYLHTNNILHRDIKPENLVLDDRGYVRITDFGIAKLYQKENSAETSGTPGYMAPEVMCGQNHTIAVDYFALGVFTYEFMFGVRPYTGKSRKEIKDKIMAKQVQIKRNEIPEGWSTEAADFINRVKSNFKIYSYFKENLFIGLV
jgi:serine/threonine protein kinase